MQAEKTMITSNFIHPPESRRSGLVLAEASQKAGITGCGFLRREKRGKKKEEGFSSCSKAMPPDR
jgi:hypothetical protein